MSERQLGFALEATPPSPQLGSPEWASYHEREKKRVLDSMELLRAELLSVARSVAIRLASEDKDGHVCAPRVLDHMRRNGWAKQMATVDARWSGAIFAGGDWKKVGKQVFEGSHKRPAELWRRMT